MISNLIYLSLGSNLGDREQNLREAWDALPPDAQPLRASPIYETPPWGYTDQPAFLNQVVQASTTLSPLDLLSALKNLEVRLGRVPNFRYGPRAIDVDILLYGDQTIEFPELTIPHPRISERAFVLVPLADLAPDMVCPGQGGRTVRELLSQVDASQIMPYDSKSSTNTFP